MGLESNPTKIADLNPLWPLPEDDPKYGDDHIRNIKAVLRLTDLGGRLVSVQKFLTPGSATWVKPSGVGWVLVISKGGGGGGASRYSTVDFGPGGGGEGGCCIQFIDVSDVSTVPVTVGAGGAGGAVGGYNGSDGGSSSFGSYHTAGGGEGGKADSIYPGRNYYRGGAGGTAVGGDINLPGACGSVGNDNDRVPIISGAGGGSGGGRARSAFEGSEFGGVSGTANSGGGGSSALFDGTGRTGGDGGSGFVVVYEFSATTGGAGASLMSGALKEVTLTANTEIAHGSPTYVGTLLTVVITQGGSGGYTITWDSTVFESSTPTEIATAVGKRTFFSFVGMSSGKWALLSPPRLEV